MELRLSNIVVESAGDITSTNSGATPGIRALVKDGK